MLLFALFLFLNKRYKANLFAIKSNKEIKVFIIVSLFLTFWALSNKIAFGSYTLLEIPLNKYIYGALSVLKSTGRMFYMVNYFLLMYQFYYLNQKMNKRKIKLKLLNNLNRFKSKI